MPLKPSYEQQDEIFRVFVSRYPNLRSIARHVRYAHSGSENSLKAYMWYEGHTFESKLFTFKCGPGLAVEGRPWSDTHRIYVLKEGRIPEAGTWDRLMEKRRDFYRPEAPEQGVR